MFKYRVKRKCQLHLPIDIMKGNGCSTKCLKVLLPSQCLKLTDVFLIAISINLFIGVNLSHATLSTSTNGGKALNYLFRMKLNLTQQLSLLEEDHLHHHSDTINDVSSGHDNHHHHRSKRGVFQLAGMISCVSGCDPLAYKGYGCYCGYGGAGIPINGIDRCCMEHDLCYTHSECSQLKQYVYPYTWDCVAPGYAVCGMTSLASMSSLGTFSIDDNHLTISVGGGGGHDRCASQLCECDLNLAICLSYYHCPKMKMGCPTTSRFTFGFSFG